MVRDKAEVKVKQLRRRGKQEAEVTGESNGNQEGTSPGKKRRVWQSNSPRPAVKMSKSLLLL